MLRRRRVRRRARVRLEQMRLPLGEHAVRLVVHSQDELLHQHRLHWRRDLPVGCLRVPVGRVALHGDMQGGLGMLQQRGLRNGRAVLHHGYLQLHVGLRDVRDRLRPVERVLHGQRLHRRDDQHVQWRHVHVQRLDPVRRRRDVYVGGLRVPVRPNAMRRHVHPLGRMLHQQRLRGLHDEHVLHGYVHVQRGFPVHGGRNLHHRRLRVPERREAVRIDVHQHIELLLGQRLHEPAGRVPPVTGDMHRRDV
jgi:hypothetical protein